MIEPWNCRNASKEQIYQGTKSLENYNKNFIMRLIKRKWVGYILLTMFVISAALITKGKQDLFAYFMHTKNSWIYENRQTTDWCRKCINTKLYEAIIYPKRIIQREIDTVLLLMSSYRKDAAARRHAIRNTLGNTNIYLPTKIQRVFVLGKKQKVTFCKQ